MPKGNRGAGVCVSVKKAWHMVVCAEWTRIRVKPGGTAEVYERFCPSKKLGTEAFSFVPNDRKGDEYHE